MSKAKIWGVFLFVAFVGVAVYYMTGRSQGPAGDLSGSSNRPKAADFKLPELTLEGALGQERSLNQFSNRVVLIHFWASWCPPCLDELPVLAQFAKKDSRIQVIAINLDESLEDARRILHKDATFKSPIPNWISLFDQKSSVSSLYGSYQYPETYLLDSKHRIVMKWIGPQEWMSDQFTKIFDHVIKI